MSDLGSKEHIDETGVNIILLHNNWDFFTRAAAFKVQKSSFCYTFFYVFLNTVVIIMGHAQANPQSEL